jgi:hypothetical protein
LSLPELPAFVRRFERRAGSRDSRARSRLLR